MGLSLGSFLFGSGGSTSRGTEARSKRAKTQSAMPRDTVYLEAASRSQDLLSLKWALKSGGYSIRSTWHDAEALTSPPASPAHWSAAIAEKLRSCDSLVILSGDSGGFTAEMAIMAGFALAHGLQLIWIGRPVSSLADFHSVQHFDTADEFRRQILEQIYSQPVSIVKRLAA